MYNHLLRVRHILHRFALSALALVTMVATSHVSAQTASIPFITTYAGLAAGATPANAICSSSLPVFAVTGTGAKYGDGCPPTQASLSVPIGVAIDKVGNLFISDQTHQIIRVVYNGTGTDALGVAITAANIENPGLVPVKGNIYTIAGGTTTAPTSHYCNGTSTGAQGDDLELDGCPGAETYEELNRGVAVDADGNVWLSNGAVYPTIRVFYVGGTKAAALIQLADPTQTPQPGYVYKVAGYGGTTLRTTGGACTGTTLTFTDVFGDGCPAVQAYLNAPRGLVVDAAENIYFADQGDNVIRRIDGTTSIITEVAGCVATTASCAAATSGDGSAAVGSSVGMNAPYGVAMDQYGNLFIAEGGSSTVAGRIRVVYAAGTLPGISGPTQGYIYTYAGGSATTGTQAQMATFQETYGVSIDALGYLYVADYRSGTSGSNHIWRVDPVTGNILILAGTGNAALALGQHCDRVKQLGIVTPNSIGDTCPATQAYLSTPQGGVVFDASGNGYFADRGNNVIRKLYYNNVFPATAVGATSALLPQAFYFPASTTLLSKTATLQGVATTEFASTTTANDNCPLAAPLPAAPDTCVSYVSFTPAAAGPRNAAYNLVDVTGVVATGAVTGTGTAPVLTIGPGTAAAIGANITPTAVSADLNGNVYVSDSKNHQVLRSTIAGGAGTAVLTGLGSPRESTVDNFGNLYVADSVNNKIVKLPAGSTTATSFGTGLSAPQGVVADLMGNVYIADTGNNRLLYYSSQNGEITPVATSPITLSAPTFLALDSAGNLYVVDTNNTRVVELSTGVPASVFALPFSVMPVAIAFDAANDVYFADTASSSILFAPAGSTTSTPLITGLGSAAGVAINASGNIFVADSAATTATAYNVAVNNSTFNTTNIPLSSLPITLKLSDVGNLGATLATPPYVETGSTAAFPSNGTPTCTAAFVLAPGSNCTQAFIFTPTVPGTQTAKVVFNTTTAQSVTANLSATATNLINTSLAIAPLNATANYGQTVTYTITLTPSSLTTPTPTGTINFLVDGKTFLSKGVTTSPYTFTFPLSTAVGVHSVSAVYTGDSVYGGSSTSTFLTVIKATTSIAVSYSQSSSGTVLSAVVTPASVGATLLTGNVLFYIDSALVATVPVVGGTLTGTASATVLLVDGSHAYYATYVGDPNYSGSTSTPVQTFVVSRAATTTTLSITATSNAGVAGFLLSAKVTSLIAGKPTGTVTFTNGATVLGTVNLSTAVNGVVSFLTSTTTYTNYTFTATYSGDGLYEPSASSGADFVVITPLVALAVAQGGQSIYPSSTPISAAPINGYTGSLTATCSGLPVNALCRFYPTPVVLAGTAPVTVSVQVFAGVNPNVASLSSPANMPRQSGHGLAVEAGATLALVLMMPVAFRMRRRGKLPYLLALALLSLAISGITGCGIKTPAYTSVLYTTPAGTYPITLTLTDTNGVTHSNVFNIVVTP